MKKIITILFLLISFGSTNAQQSDPCCPSGQDCSGKVTPDGGWCEYVKATRESGEEPSAYAICMCENGDSLDGKKNDKGKDSEDRSDEEENKEDKKKARQMTCNEIQAYYSNNKYNMSASDRQYWHKKAYECEHGKTTGFLSGIDVDAKKQTQHREFVKQKQFIEQNSRISDYNMEIGEELGASAIIVHFLIGKLIYSGIGNFGAENIYKTRTSAVHLKYGYGLSFTPMISNVILTNYDYSTISDSRNATPFIVDLHFGMDYNLLYGDNYGLGTSFDIAGGHQLFFEAFKWQGQVGLQGYFGFKNAKLYMAYDAGQLNININSWIIASHDEYGKLRNGYGKFMYGPRFSWDNNKKHLDLLIIREKPNSLTNTLIQNKKGYRGYRINFWDHHKFDFFIEYFPKYAVSGTRDFSTDREFKNEKMYFSIGVLRAFDIFTQGVGEQSLSSLKSKAEKKHRWILSPFPTPVLTKGFITNGTDSLVSGRAKLSMNAFTVEKEISLPYNFSVTGGIGWSAFNGINVVSKQYINSQFFGMDFQNNRNVSIEYYAIDIPIGIYYSPDIFGLDKYWLSIKRVKNYKIFDIDIKSQTPDGESFSKNGSELYFNKNTTTYEFGIGGDFAYTSNNSIRAGVYYFKQKETIFNSLYQSEIKGLKLSLALLF